MILVVLGTQDKAFSRLLKAVDKEIEKGNIQEKVVVQAGQTVYESDKMEIFDLLPAPEFEKLMDEADLIITHGGAGTILSAIKKGKKVIAAARLAKYKEHHNDHQKQIIGEFSSKGYILELTDFQKLGSLIQKSKTFKPKKFVSNTKKMISLLDQYIEDTNHISWYNRYYFWFHSGFSIVINLLLFLLFCFFPLNVFINNLLSCFLTFILFFFILTTNNSQKRYCFFACYLLLDMIGFYFLYHEMSMSLFLSKFVVEFFMGIINCFIYFRKRKDGVYESSK